MRAGPTSCGFFLPDPNLLGYAGKSVLKGLFLIVGIGSVGLSGRVGPPPFVTYAIGDGTVWILVALKQAS